MGLSTRSDYEPSAALGLELHRALLAAPLQFTFGKSPLGRPLLSLKKFEFIYKSLV